MGIKISGVGCSLDLYRTCAWGICSGGLAGIYAGGVYAESQAGEKYRWLKSYVDQYWQQIDNLDFAIFRDDLADKRNYRP